MPPITQEPGTVNAACLDDYLLASQGQLNPTRPYCARLRIRWTLGTVLRLRPLIRSVPTDVAISHHGQYQTGSRTEASSDPTSVIYDRALTLSLSPLSLSLSLCPPLTPAPLPTPGGIPASLAKLFPQISSSAYTSSEDVAGYLFTLSVRRQDQDPSAAGCFDGAMVNGTGPPTQPVIIQCYSFLIYPTPLGRGHSSPFPISDG